MARFMRISGGDEGATSAEYAIMASLIAAVILGAVAMLGESVTDLFTDADEQFSEAREE